MSEDIDKGFVTTVIVKDPPAWQELYRGRLILRKSFYPKQGALYRHHGQCGHGQPWEQRICRIYQPFNEWYPKKHEQKVKEVKKAKGLAGEHLGAPPYGYLRNPDDNTRWLVDEEAAAVVRRIFFLCMQGMSAIATILWEEKVLYPVSLQSVKGRRRGEGSGKSVLLGAVSRSCYSGKCGVYRLYGELQIHPFGL